MGFGPIAPEKDEPVFRAEWEKRALALTLAAAGLGEWNIDVGQHARESLRPVDYLTSSYYEVWIKASKSLLIAHRLASAEEIANGKAIGAPKPTRPALAHAAAALCPGQAQADRTGPCAPFIAPLPRRAFRDRAADRFRSSSPASPAPPGGPRSSRRSHRDVDPRVRALESLLIEKGYVDPGALDAIVETTRPGSARATAVER